jgi:hypothetical protein
MIETIYCSCYHACKEQVQGRRNGDATMQRLREHVSLSLSVSHTHYNTHYFACRLLLLPRQHDFIRLNVVGSIVGESEAVSSDGKPAVAPIVELLVHGQVAGGRGVRIKLSACAAIRDVNRSITELTTAEHILYGTQAFVKVHVTSHYKVNLPSAPKKT